MCDDVGRCWFVVLDGAKSLGLRRQPETLDTKRTEETKEPQSIQLRGSQNSVGWTLFKSVQAWTVNSLAFLFAFRMGGECSLSLCCPVCLMGDCSGVGGDRREGKVGGRWFRWWPGGK